MNTSSSIGLSLVCTLLSSGCGDAAPPGGDNPNSADYYPMLDGAVSVYRHSSNGGWDETITLTRTAAGEFFEVDTPNPDGERTESVQTVDVDGRVWRTSKQQYVDDQLDIAVEYEPGFIRFDPAWLDLAQNESVRMAYQRTETPAGGSPDPTRERAHVYTSFGLQTVDVLGKTYRDCLVIQRERDYEDTQGNTEDQKKQFYFAPGVGKVWEINIDSGNTEELVSTTVPE